jgi:hypothetical protein
MAPGEDFETFRKQHARTPIPVWTQMILDSVDKDRWALVVDDLPPLSSTLGRLLDGGWRLVWGLTALGAGGALALDAGLSGAGRWAEAPASGRPGLLCVIGATPVHREGPPGVLR